MNPVINISLLILGIVFLVVPPIGLAILALAGLGFACSRERKKRYRNRVMATRIEQARRTKILAYKSL